MSEPTQPADAATDMPRAAVIELVERHTGDKYPHDGYGSIICPNHLRIDGVAVLATVDHPATVEEIAVTGVPGVPFRVTVELFARALSFGAEPTFYPGAVGGPESNSAAVVEIPDADYLDLEPGVDLERPYVLLNGKRVYVDGPIVVGKLATGGPDRTAAMVRLTLLCRRFLVDDEPVTPTT